MLYWRARLRKNPLSNVKSLDSVHSTSEHYLLFLQVEQVKNSKHWCFSFLCFAVCMRPETDTYNVRCESCKDIFSLTHTQTKNKYRYYKLLVEFKNMHDLHAGSWECYNDTEESDVSLTIVICQFPASHFSDFCLLNSQYFHLYSDHYLWKY